MCGQPAYDAEFLDAFHWWLSEKAEWWLEMKKGGGPLALTEWTAELWEDQRIQAAWQVAAETDARLELWKANQREAAAGQGPQSALTDASRAAFARYLKVLVREQSVPEGLPYAVPWSELEKSHNVSAAVKKIRGKLNVPRERFWVTADGLYRTVVFK